MKLTITILLLICLGYVVFPDIYSAITFGLTSSIVVRILLKSNEFFMFREWTLLLYAFNYLLSPAISYRLDMGLATYPMKISPDAYFSMAIPGVLLFSLGMFCIPTKIFQPDFSAISRITFINERFLILLTFFGVFCSLIISFLPTELAFFIYLLSLIRFVGVLALFASHPSKYIYFALLIIGISLYEGFRNALFHDAIMWLIFFALFYLYVAKPNLIVKLASALFLLLFVLLIQAYKNDYRERVWTGSESANFQTITNVGYSKANSEDLIGTENLLNTLNRGNQAWIFASTVDNMNRTKDFQGMNNLYLYLESAILPRFLAPNKITAGNTLIFNRFSGHYISSGTSMGLGVFADGYIAYGNWGVYIFTFALGLLFALTFKIVQGWAKISTFYVLLILPILNYAVRPDCELQTTINHLVKSVVVFGGLVYLTKYRFTLDTINSIKK